MTPRNIITFLVAVLLAGFLFFNLIRHVDRALDGRGQGASHRVTPKPFPRHVPAAAALPARSAELQGQIDRSQRRIDAIGDELQDLSGDNQREDRDRLNDLRASIQEQQEHIKDLESQMQTRAAATPAEQTFRQSQTNVEDLISQEAVADLRRQVRQQEAATAAAQESVTHTAAPDDSDLMVQLHAQLQTENGRLTDLRSQYDALVAEQENEIQARSAQTLQEIQSQRDNQVEQELEYSQAQSDLQEMNQEYEQVEMQETEKRNRIKELQDDRDREMQVLQRLQQNGH